MGVVSFGPRVCSGNYGGYARVSWAKDWIKETLRDRWGLALDAAEAPSAAPSALPRAAPSALPRALPTAAVGPTRSAVQRAAPSSATPTVSAAPTRAPKKANTAKRNEAGAPTRAPKQTKTAKRKGGDARRDGRRSLLLAPSRPRHEKDASTADRRVTVRSRTHPHPLHCYSPGRRHCRRVVLEVQNARYHPPVCQVGVDRLGEKGGRGWWPHNNMTRMFLEVHNTP